VEIIRTLPADCTAKAGIMVCELKHSDNFAISILTAITAFDAKQWPIVIRAVQTTLVQVEPFSRQTTVTFWTHAQQHSVAVLVYEI